MTLLMFIELFGGLGLFIYGMHLMSEGLKIVAGTRMKLLLERLTNTPLKALLCGIIVTIMVQSSSTTTVMVVGFVNASLMSLTQAAGIILGSNIGTTLMAQIIAFDITSYAVFFIGLGTFLALFAKQKKMKDWGSIILGFGILFYGISTMSSAVEPLNDDPVFIDLLITYGKNPIVGLLASAIMTGILQSSGAVIGLVQALAISGAFASTTGTEAIQICIPFIIGSNIGTCITALLSSIGTSNTAKDAAYIHLFVNIFGALWVMPLLYLMDHTMAVNPIYQFIVNISGSSTINGQVVPNVARQIAMSHSLFNIANTVILFPFMGLIVKVVEKILPPEPAEEGLKLDWRLLNTPGVALGQAQNELSKMSRITAKNFGRAMDALITLSEEKIDKTVEVEKTIDEFEHGLQDYVIQISNLNMSAHQNDQVAFIIENSHTIERIGDHSKILAELAQEMIEKDAQFSENMIESIKKMKTKVGDMLDQVTAMLKEPTEIDRSFALVREEAEVDHYVEKLRRKRINNKEIESKKIFPTFVFVDVLTNVERISTLAEVVSINVHDLQTPHKVASLKEVVY